MAKKKEKELPKLHKDLQGFSIDINEFGEFVSNRTVEDLNKFLDKNLEDKKLSEKETSKKAKKN